MKMNQWVDFDIGDEAQSEYVFSYMGKTYSIELSLSVGFGDIWFANLYSVTGDKKQKCVSNIKIPTCDFDELSWLKQYLEKRMDMLLLELKNEVSSVSFEPEEIAGLHISSDDKIKLLDMLHGLWFDVYKMCRKIRKQVSYHLKNEKGSQCKKCGRKRFRPHSPLKY